jgi:hypothetical protein
VQREPRLDPFRDGSVVDADLRGDIDKRFPRGAQQANAISRATRWGMKKSRLGVSLGSEQVHCKTVARKQTARRALRDGGEPVFQPATVQVLQDLAWPLAEL